MQSFATLLVVSRKDRCWSCRELVPSGVCMNEHDVDWDRAFRFRHVEGDRMLKRAIRSGFSPATIQNGRPPNG